MKREECRWLNGSAINPTLKAGRVYGFSQLPSTYGARTSEQAPFPSHVCSVLCVLVSSHGGWASGVVTDAGSGPLPPIDLRRLRAPVRSTINGTRLNKAIDGIRTLVWRRSTL
jgi:hypothetical protein